MKCLNIRKVLAISGPKNAAAMAMAMVPPEMSQSESPPEILHASLPGTCESVTICERIQLQQKALNVELVETKGCCSIWKLKPFIRI